MADEFLELCKSYYFQQKLPVLNGEFSLDENDKLVKIAMNYFQESRYVEFSGFFMEYQYLVNLWTAHLFLEYGNLEDKIKNQSLKIIRRYANSSLNPQLAKEEQIWLSSNSESYEDEDNDT